MADGRLTYNGTTYRLSAGAAADLLTQGVIVPVRGSPGQFELALDHLVEEIDAALTVVERTTGEAARGEIPDPGRRRMLAVRFRHGDGQGGR